MAIFKLVEGLTWAGIAGEDLSTAVNKLVKLDTDGTVILAGDDEKALGTLFEAGDEGAAVSVQMGGIAKIVASAAITVGARVGVAAGGLAKSGTTNPVGLALSGASGANSVISVALVQ